MNCKDIEAAKRLIAQFEERADGRHNSTALATRATETRPVLVEAPNNLLVTPQPSHGGLRFIDGFQRYMEHLRAIGLPQELAIREREAMVDRACARMRDVWGVNLPFAPIRERWQDCEIGDYCQIPGTQFEQYNTEQKIIMIVQILDRLRDF